MGVFFISGCDFVFAGSRSITRRPNRENRGQRSVSRPLFDNYTTSDVAIQVRMYVCMYMHVYVLMFLVVVRSVANSSDVSVMLSRSSER